MNKYEYDDMYEGLTEQFSVTVDDAMMKKFLDITGDNNPMHINGEKAKEKGFEDRIVYGMLTASFYSTLAGVYMPGEKCLLQEVNTSFYKPVYIGDQLTIVGKVKEKNDEFKRVVINGVIRNQKNERVSKARIIVGFYE